MRMKFLESASPYIGEFLGTFLLTLTATCNSIGKTDPQWAATSIAAVLVALIYSLGPVSGAELNPAVSLGLLFAKRVGEWNRSLPQVCIYMLMQLVAGVLAGFCGRWLYGIAPTFGPKPGYSWWEAWVGEMLYTAMLVFVVLNCAVSQRNNPKITGQGNQFYGLAIGFVIVAAGYAIGPISGAALNPAVSIGIAVGGFENGVGWGFAYWGFEVLGSIIGVLMYSIVRPEEYDETLTNMRDYRVKLATQLSSEFIGTFFVVLTYGLNMVNTAVATSAGAQWTGPWSTGAAYMSMIYSLGDVSGGHFNPAITITVFASLQRQIKGVAALLFLCIQIVAAILGGFMYAALQGGVTFEVHPPPGFVAGAIWSEVIFTLMICLIVLTVGIVKVKPLSVPSYYYGLAVGGAITAGGIASASTSGGIFNPAVALACPVVDTINGGGLFFSWVFILSECVGAVLAAFIFMVTHAEYYQKEEPTSS